MEVRSYALLGNSELRRVEQRIGVALSTWAADWGLNKSDVSVTCWRSWEAPASHRDDNWQQSYARGEKRAWLSWSPDLPKYVQRQMFPVDVRHAPQTSSAMSMASAGGAAATNALAEAVAQQFDLIDSAAAPHNGPEPHLFDRASGAIVIVLKIGEHSMRCLANFACVRVIRESGEPLRAPPLGRVDWAKALSATPVSLKVTLGQVEVALGNFISLDVGDVVRLPSSIDKPLPVMGPDDRILFGGHLGTQTHSKAIEAVLFPK
jgi:hypothetical protein